MKKILLAAAVVLGLAAATTAQNTTTTQAPAQCPATQCADTCNRPPRFNPFDGIQLTADQQTAIQTLDNQRRQARQEARQERRDARQQRDGRRNDDRRDYLNQLKQILSPEQYVQFLENNYLHPARPQAGPQNRNGRPEGNREARRGHGERRQHSQHTRTQQVATPATTAATAN